MTNHQMKGPLMQLDPMDPKGALEVLVNQGEEEKLVGFKRIPKYYILIM